MRSLFRSSVVAAITLTAPFALHAQVVGGSISGVVADSTGQPIHNAQVLVHNTETGTERHLLTGTDGRYTAPSLAIGRYDITVTSPGFGEQKRTGIVLTVGQSNTVDIRLSVGQVAEQVQVDATPNTVDISTQQTSGLVNERQVKELPLNGRSYDQLILLNPGTVNYTNQRSGGIGSSNSSVGNMFSVAGRRPQDNIFLLNGIEYTGASLINVTPGGTSGQLLGVDAVREFNVITDTYGAGYGKRDGAQISIVTASGTNQVHGDLYEFARNSFFDARNFFDGSRVPEFQRNSFGAAVGGPIRKDKVFLFANYEGFRQNLGLSLVTDEPDLTSQAKVVASVKPLLNLWPTITPTNATEVYVNGVATGIDAVTGTAPQHIREDFGTTRLDANLSPKDLAFAVYTIDDSTAHTPSPDPFSVVDERLREQVLSVQNTHTVSPRLINISRVGYSRASYYFLGSVPSAQAALVGSTLSISGKPTAAVVIAGSTASNGASSITSAGVNVGSNNGITRNLLTADDHIYWTLGKHTIEAGVWFQRLQSNDNLQQDQDGQASFASLAAFETGTIKTFTYGPVATELGWRATFVDGYLEDTFHPLARLEIRAGFRSQSSTGWSESQGRAGVYTFTNGIINTIPSVQSNGIDNNRALFLPEPRLGVAWDVFGNGKTSVRAGVGLHHSLLDALDYRLDQAAPYNTIYAYSSTTVANPTSGTPLISPSTVDPGIATPSLLAYDLKIEQQIARATSLTVAYSGSHSSHQILNGDLNEPSYTVQNGSVFYPAGGTTTTPAAPVKVNPAVANTTSWWSGGTGSYNSLIVDVRHDLSHGLQFRANYTWSKNLDDGSAWNTSVSANTPAFVEVPSLPHLDYGPAATDIRTIGSFNATYELPFGDGKTFLGKTGAVTSRFVSGWSLSTIAQLLSGFPFSPQLGYNPTGSGDSRNPVRPQLNPAFTGPLYTSGSTSARAAQYFNINAYTPPAAGYIGNAGRDSLRGPGYADWDVSLIKSTRISEQARLQFRAEFFNVLNHTNLSLPNEIVYSAGPTQGTTANQNTAVQANAPNITSTAGTSRQIQLGAKVTF